MRPIHLAHLDKTRPVLLLTRAEVRPHLKRITVAPITSVVRGLTSEVAVGQANGLDHASVVSCDNVVTVPQEAIGRLIGHLMPEQGRRCSEPLPARSIWRRRRALVGCSPLSVPGQLRTAA